MAILPIIIREAPGGMYQDTTHTNTSFILSISLSIGFSLMIVCGLCWRRRSRNRQLAAQRRATIENVPLQNVPRRKVLARNLLQSIPVIIWRAPRESIEEGDGNVSANDDANGAKLSRASSEGNTVGQTQEGDGRAQLKNLNAPVTVIEMAPSDGAVEASRRLSCSRLVSRSCCICTEDFTEGSTVRILPCMHSYHTRCIDPWLLDFAGTCPICRTDFQNIEPTPEEPLESPQSVLLTGETAPTSIPAPIHVPEFTPVPGPVSGPGHIPRSELVPESAFISIPAPVHVPVPAPTP